MKLQTVDVVVIGGGLAGTAIGYHCAALGLDVVIVERVTLGGGGATRYSRGIVRVYDPDARLMRWGLQGATAWRNWDIPGPNPFHACGVVYLLAEASVADALGPVACHDNPSYPIRILRGQALLDRFPQLRLADRDASKQVAVYEPHGGYCDPRLAARLYGEAVRHFSGSVLEGIDVRAITPSESSVRIITESNSLEGKVAVLAAGAYASELVPSLPMFSRTIPLSCLQDESNRVHCCVIDEVTGAYLRPEPPTHFYCGGGQQTDAKTPTDLPGFSRTIHDTHSASLEVLLVGSPGLVIGGVMGYDGYTEDFNPLLGFHPDHHRLCLATGFSGRGAKYIPAIAQSLASDIFDRVRNEP